MKTGRTIGSVIDRNRERAKKEAEARETNELLRRYMWDGRALQEMSDLERLRALCRCIEIFDKVDELARDIRGAVSLGG